MTEVTNAHWTVKVKQHGIFLFELNPSNPNLDLGAISECGVQPKTDIVWFLIENEKHYYEFANYAKCADFKHKSAKTFQAAVNNKLKVPLFFIISFFN